MEHIRQAHLKDGTAMTRFLYWVKHTVGKEPVTEVSAGEQLEALRRQQEGYLGPSFDTIVAYGDNAAMCHYVATPESDRTVEPRGFLLVDAGGQYQDGTTDTTRTIVVGPVTEQERLHYTLVLKGMIGLSKICFRQGYTGWNLDFAARRPLWEHGLDFNHGTGHGVRHENLQLCHQETAQDAVPFLYFETVTLCPIDTEAIDLSYLDADEKHWLNAYHRRVYEQIGPRLPEQERQWLQEVTKEI